MKACNKSINYFKHAKMTESLWRKNFQKVRSQVGLFWHRSSQNDRWNQMFKVIFDSIRWFYVSAWDCRKLQNVTSLLMAMKNVSNKTQLDINTWWINVLTGFRESFTNRQSIISASVLSSVVGDHVWWNLITGYQQSLL